MCQHTVLNDGLDNSQKGKSPVTSSVVCCLQNMNAVFYVDSMTNIDCGAYVYKDATKILDFLPALSPIILGGVGHCFAWHVRVNLGFYFSFKIEVLVHSGLCAM